LLGYLLAKSLWNKFADSFKSPPHRPAAFLDFLWYYIYEDWGLARVLMSPGRIQVEDVLAHLTGRLNKLIESDIAAKAMAFIKDKSSRSEKRGTLRRGAEELRYGPFQGLDLTADEMEQGMRATMSFYAQRVAPTGVLSDQRPTIENLQNLQHEMHVTEVQANQGAADYRERHRLRDDCPVRVLDFIIEVADSKRAFCYLLDLDIEVRGRDDKLILSIPGDPSSEQILPTTSASGFTDEPRAGRLFGVIASTAKPWRFYAFVLCDNTLVTMWTQGTSMDQAEQLNLLATIQTELALESTAQLSFVALNDYFIKNEAGRDRIKASADAATQAMAEQLRELLKQTGWAGLFGDDAIADFGLRRIVPKTADVRALAAAGLCNAFTTDRTEMENLMEKAGYRLSDALEASKTTKKRTGVSLIQTQKQQVFIRV
jgi:hypothetical protein